MDLTAAAEAEAAMNARKAAPKRQKLSAWEWLAGTARHRWRAYFRNLYHEACAEVLESDTGEPLPPEKKRNEDDGR